MPEQHWTVTIDGTSTTGTSPMALEPLCIDAHRRRVPWQVRDSAGVLALCSEYNGEPDPDARRIYIRKLGDEIEDLWLRDLGKVPPAWEK